MRTIWNGSISFGLVNIPVGLAPATAPKAKQSDVSFRTLHRECKTPIQQKRWCPTHEREVGPDEIVKGWEVAKGEFVIVEVGEGQQVLEVEAVQLGPLVVVFAEDAHRLGVLDHIGAVLRRAVCVDGCSDCADQA